MRLAPLAVLCALAASAAAYPDMSPIRREFRAHVAEYRACYEAALPKHPKLEGKVTVTVVILRDGSVGEASSEGMPEIDGCIARVARTMKFPAGAKGPIKVMYPFVFQVR